MNNAKQILPLVSSQTCVWKIPWDFGLSSEKMDLLFAAAWICYWNQLAGSNNRARTWESEAVGPGSGSGTLCSLGKHAASFVPWLPHLSAGAKEISQAPKLPAVMNRELPQQLGRMGFHKHVLHPLLRPLPQVPKVPRFLKPPVGT